MIVLLVITFFSGLLTILAPCIWPLLPIVLSSTYAGGKKKAFALTLGICVSFAVVTLSLSYLTRLFPLNPDSIRLIAVAVIAFMGFTFLIPRLSAYVESKFSLLSNKLYKKRNISIDGIWGTVLVGISTGIVWSPCAGPILATIASIASTRAVNAEIVAITFVYVLGVGIPLYFFATIGQKIFKSKSIISQYNSVVQKIFGIILILTSLLIYTGYDRTLQVRLLDYFPSYSKTLTKIESSFSVDNTLEKITSGSENSQTNLSNESLLGDYGKAPDFVGISNWLNSDPLSLFNLKGKVVLVDFWTYSCINCIRTLPYLTSWHDKYKDEGLIIVGVHTPEFEFEKDTQNVQDSLKSYDISYPVAQDNNYRTWRAYNNRYWPAKYLIDSKGIIRYYHFGEGAYEETERIIQTLLEETNKETVNLELTKEVPTDRKRTTPETYLGSLRMEYFYPSKNLKNGEEDFTLPNTIPMNTFSFGGKWTINDEYSESNQGSILEIVPEAKDIFLVMGTSDETTIQVEIIVDNVKREVLDVKETKLYEIARFQSHGSRTIQLRFNGTVQVYAFTFG